MDLIGLKSFIPEIFFSIVILFQLLFNVKITNNMRYNFPIVEKEVYYQSAFIFFCLLFLYFNLKFEGVFFNLLLLTDQGVKVSKILVIFFCLITLPIIKEAFNLQFVNFFEFFSLFLLSVLASLFLISSNDLMIFYLVIEMQSLCFYVLATLKRKSSFSTESGLKYFIFGSFISGIFLFGSSLIYGNLGTLNVQSISLILMSYEFQNSLNSLNLGLFLVTAVFLFKIGSYPFNFWLPDIYEGSILSSTIIFSTIPKISLYFFILKWVNFLFIFDIKNKYIFLIFGLVSIIVGTLYALKQVKIKRFLICSSLSQTGFLIIALSSGNIQGYSSTLFYLLGYLLALVLLWSQITLMYSLQKKVALFYKNFTLDTLYLSDFIEFFKVNKFVSLILVVSLFSLGGIPPFLGFYSKVFILSDLISLYLIFESVVIILISCLSVYYYLKIIKIIFFEKENKTHVFLSFRFVSSNISFICIFCLYLILIYSLYPTLLWFLCHDIILSSKIY